MELANKIMEFRCKEKLLPHYFGRMVYAHDLVNYDVMEGKGSQVSIPLALLYVSKS